MLSKVLLLVTVFSLVACWNASAQERTPVGETSAVLLQVDVKGNRAKFNEYRALRDGVHGYIGLRYDAERTYINFRADDMGYRDQKYELNGGRRESFTYHLTYDEIPHHFTFGNRAFP
jgi:hypothetical protein